MGLSLEKLLDDVTIEAARPEDVDQKDVLGALERHSAGLRATGSTSPAACGRSTTRSGPNMQKGIEG